MPAPIPLELIRAKLEALGLPGLQLRGPVYRAEKYRCIRAFCFHCSTEKEYHVDNLLSGKTTACKCQRGVKYEGDPFADVFGDRYDAIKQRCTNSNCASYDNYGGRGIECRFESREAFVRYMLELRSTLYREISAPSDLKDYDIERLDNNGHYAPGNLALVPHAENLRNTRRTRFTTYKGLKVVASDLWHLLKRDLPSLPYAHEWVTKLAKQGRTGEEIIDQGASGKLTAGRPVTAPQSISPRVLAKYDGRKVRIPSLQRRGRKPNAP